MDEKSKQKNMTFKLQILLFGYWKTFVRLPKINYLKTRNVCFWKRNICKTIV